MDLREFTKGEHRGNIDYMVFLQNVIATLKMQLSRPTIASVTRRKEQLRTMLAVADDALLEEKTQYEN